MGKLVRGREKMFMHILTYGYAAGDRSKQVREWGVLLFLEQLKEPVNAVYVQCGYN